MRRQFEGLFVCAMLFGVVLPLPAQEAAKNQAPLAAKPNSGTFVIKGKTYKLEHVMAYESKYGDEVRITILASDRRIPVDEVRKTLGKEKGNERSELGLFLNHPNIRFDFSLSGKPIWCRGLGDGLEFGGRSKLTGELKLDAGRARGQVTMTSTAQSGSFVGANCELTFDVVVGADPVIKPVARPSGPVNPTVSGTFKVNGSPAKLAFVSAHPTEPFADKAAFNLVITELDHSKDKKPDVKARSREYGNALIIQLHEYGNLTGCEVVHSEKSFSIGGAFKTDSFDFGDGQVSGHITSNGDAKSYAQSWEVDIKFAAPFTEPLIQPMVAEKPSQKSRDNAGLNVHDLPIPKDATEVKLTKFVERITFNSPADVKTMADTFSIKLEEQKWSKTGVDLVSPKGAILNRKNGIATLRISVTPSDKGSTVSISASGLSWEEKQPATDGKTKVADKPADKDAVSVPVPENAKKVSKTADSHMQIEFPAGKGVAAAETIRDQLLATEWISDNSDPLRKPAGNLTFKKAGKTLVLTYVDPGIGDAKVILMGVGLKLEQGEVDPKAKVPVTGSTPKSTSKPETDALTADSVANLLKKAGQKNATLGNNADAPAAPAVPDKPKSGTAKLLTDAQKLENSGNLLVNNTPVKLGNVVAYEFLVSGKKKTAINFTDKPIPLPKLKALLAKDGSDMGLFDFDSQAKLEFDQKGELSVILVAHNNDSFPIIGGSNVISDVIIEDNRARGTVKLGEPKKFSGKSYSLELTFDVEVLKLPATNEK